VSGVAGAAADVRHRARGPTSIDHLVCATRCGGRGVRRGWGRLATMLVAFSVAPSGGGSDSVGDVVAEAVRVVRESGLPCETTSMFTTIEAPTWDEAMEVVKRAVEVVAARAPRVSLVLKADIRPGWSGQLQAKVERVERALGGPAPD
jgi:uncharacterized protein (TIGR00106 family)